MKNQGRYRHLTEINERILVLGFDAKDIHRGRSKSTRLASIGESPFLGLSGTLRQSGEDL